jgi:hypothetical protein
MLGAVNSVAGLLGTADRSTNIELATCVNSGFCGASMLPGATDPFTDEEQETVITTVHVPAAAANSLRRLAPPTTTSFPARSRPARAWLLTADRSCVAVEYRGWPYWLVAVRTWLSIRVDLVKRSWRRDTHDSSISGHVLSTSGSRVTSAPSQLVGGRSYGVLLSAT